MVLVSVPQGQHLDADVLCIQTEETNVSFFKTERVVESFHKLAISIRTVRNKRITGNTAGHSVTICLC